MKGRPSEPFADMLALCRRGPDECWIWQGTRSQGYGNHAHKAAHRVSYELFKGPIPEGLVVRHTCDVRPCINPAHLLVGTRADNSRDMVERRRHHRNGAHYNARLRPEQVVEIRRRRAAGESLERIGEAYGIAPKTVEKIASRRAWAWLSDGVSV